MYIYLSSLNRNKMPTAAQSCPFFCWNKSSKSDLTLFWRNGRYCIASLLPFSQKNVWESCATLADRFGCWVCSTNSPYDLWHQPHNTMQMVFIWKKFCRKAACPKVFSCNKFQKVFFNSILRKIAQVLAMSPFYTQSFRIICSNQRVMRHFGFEMIFQEPLWFF